MPSGVQSNLKDHYSPDVEHEIILAERAHLVTVWTAEQLEAYERDGINTYNFPSVQPVQITDTVEVEDDEAESDEDYDFP